MRREKSVAMPNGGGDRWGATEAPTEIASKVYL